MADPNVLLVSFFIEYDNADTYGKIYDSRERGHKEGSLHFGLVGTIHLLLCGPDWENSATFAARVASEGRMRKSKDILVVMDANLKAGATWGAITNNTSTT